MRKSLRNHFLIFSVLLALLGLPRSQAQAHASPDVIVVDATAPSHPFPHFWEKIFGSGRAILSLRES
ncbi:MAG TPA: hypothetical protein VJK29_14170, partial [Terriglobales bacterium]|nr:hypothetical protein [Terriglobales bacterium]